MRENMKESRDWWILISQRAQPCYDLSLAAPRANRSVIKAMIIPRVLLARLLILNNQPESLSSRQTRRVGI